jgi:signal transduction histidine kinase
MYSDFAAFQDLDQRLVARLETRSIDSINLSHRLGSLKCIERTTVARELHDCGSQELAVAILSLRRAFRACNQPSCKDDLLVAMRAVDEASAQIRTLVLELRSEQKNDDELSSTSHGCLVSAVRKAVVTPTFSWHFGWTGLPRPVPEAVISQVAPIFKEASANVLKHSRATRARCTIAFQSESICILLTDNGIGFSPRSRAECGGLLGMAERARILSASLEIKSCPGKGTFVRLSLPYPESSWTNGTPPKARSPVMPTISEERFGGVAS